MQKEFFHVGDVGARINFRIKKKDKFLGPSDIASIEIKVKKPDETDITWHPETVGDAIYYITKEGDLDQAGVWTVYPIITPKTGGRFSGTADRFRVAEVYSDSIP